jgi:hypothetical protein
MRGNGLRPAQGTGRKNGMRYAVCGNGKWRRARQKLISCGLRVTGLLPSVVSSPGYRRSWFWFWLVAGCWLLVYSLRSVLVAGYALRVAGCGLRVTDGLPITDYRLPITEYRIPITDYRVTGLLPSVVSSSLRSSVLVLICQEKRTLYEIISLPRL